MKKYKHRNKKKKANVNKQIAAEIENELRNQLDIKILPNNQGVLYKDYVITEMPNQNFGLFNYINEDFIDQFYLKTSALLAAQAYWTCKLDRYQQIKDVDRRFWANQLDLMICQNSMKSTQDYEKYLITLNKYETCKYKTDQYKSEISKMFRWAFV